MDDVYFDGVKLARSTLSSSDISLSALVDTVSTDSHRTLENIPYGYLRGIRSSAAPETSSNMSWHRSVGPMPRSTAQKHITSHSKSQAPCSPSILVTLRVHCRAILIPIPHVVRPPSRPQTRPVRAASCTAGASVIPF